MRTESACTVTQGFMRFMLVPPQTTEVVPFRGSSDVVYNFASAGSPPDLVPRLEERSSALPEHVSPGRQNNRRLIKRQEHFNYSLDSHTQPQNLGEVLVWPSGGWGTRGYASSMSLLGLSGCS